MIVIRMLGQLGNQMFYWALYRQLQYEGKTVKFDISFFDDINANIQIFKVFQCNMTKASSYDINVELDKNRDLISRIRRRLFGRRNYVITESLDSSTYSYNSNVFRYSRGYLDGYWQSEKYFNEVKSIVRDDFSYPAFTDKRNIDLAQKIQQTVSVSIHVRRGDYIGLFPLLDMEYYKKAISYFTDRFEGVVFYVFSNDVAWCRTHFDEGCVFVDWNNGAESFNDMHLMSLCSHNIIANSSFSWWGAWLNNNPDKIVIAPQKWFDHAENPDIYCKNWIIM